LPGLVFNGSSHFFKLTDRFDNSTGEYTIYLVYQPVVIPATNQVILEKRSTTGTVFPYKLELESTGFYKLSDSTGSVYGAKKASAGKVNVIVLTRSASTLGIDVDDVYKTGAGGTAVNSDELIIGALNANPLIVFNNGRIGELIIFERDLATAEKADIEAYLFKKWKIEKDATKAGVCSTSAVTNSTGTMAVGASSFSCVAGYTFSVGGSTPSCSGAPNLAFTANGATCVQSYCFVNNAKYTPSIVTVANAGSVTCKNGGTNPSGCTCSGSPSWTFACANAGSCT